jgi:hypothetical protein
MISDPVILNIYIHFNVPLQATGSKGLGRIKILDRINRIYRMLHRAKTLRRREQPDKDTHR